MIKQNPLNNDISLLEKGLINWATPVESLLIWPFIQLGVKAKPKYQEFIEEYGLFKGFWHAKIQDYQRLLDHVSENGNIPENILKIYGETICGSGMKMVYKTLR